MKEEQNNNASYIFIYKELFQHLSLSCIHTFILPVDWERKQMLSMAIDKLHPVFNKGGCEIPSENFPNIFCIIGYLFPEAKHFNDKILPLMRYNSQV